MAIKQSEKAKGREATVTSYVHGARMVQISTYQFSENFVAANDKLELGLLPADAQLVGAQLIGENIGSVNATIGLMSGQPGDTDDARTVGSQLANAAAAGSGPVVATTLACLNVAKSNVHRSVGVTFSGNITAAANRKVTLVLEYVH